MSDQYPPQSPPPPPGAGYPTAPMQAPPAPDAQLGYGPGSPPPPGYGAPASTGDPSGGKRRGKKVLVAGAIVGALAVAGGGTWAVTSFMSGGADPADAIPASAIGMVKVNLDPSGSQKIEAAKMLSKFPKAEDSFDFNAEDWRKQAFEKIQSDGQTCPDVNYDQDIATWLGDRFAIAALPPAQGATDPEPIAVIEVKDGDKALAGLKKLNACASERELVGYAVKGDWAVVARTEDVAAQALKDAENDSLSGDSTYDKWVNEAGGEGLLTAYLAPSASKYLSDAFSNLAAAGANPLDPALGAFTGLSDSSTGPAMGGLEGMTPEQLKDLGLTDQEIAELGLADGAATAASVPTAAPTPSSEQLQKLFEKFDGAAMTLRFADAGLEFEAASSTMGQESNLSDDSGDAVKSLPAGTMAAFGLGLKQGWVQDYLQQLEDSGVDRAEIDSTLASIEDETGLSLPEDLETFLGESFAVSVGRDIDIDAISNSDSLDGIPVGVKIKGNAGEIQGVMDKIAPQLGAEAAPYLEQSAEGDYVAYGPDPAYRAELVKGGTLGESDAWKSVIKSDDASMAFFVNFSAGDALVEQASGDDPDVMDWWKPLNAFGASAWAKDDVSHSLVRITTD